MDLGMVGLGRMGIRMARRILRAGHRVVAFDRDPAPGWELAREGFTGRVPDPGEGRRTVRAALEEAVPAPVISAAIHARFRSRRDHGLGEKLLSPPRRQFGGHAEAPPAGEE
jgi:6-phosphogluconate dehydrogenase (decarboxylating)